ncbi:hypothetical protein EDF46_2070 [Frondihabitans sp. PhB188]|uniref:hypothetical protein n=1 Tax=Frondihabitans sp. PhB188 TaxID=2485200 RepID=UPI000F4A881B|nr:hypothetical protein [Frondihabitans sp. PhB188]ROQ38432.1 hypothetical protein EDF46_2070 [Frondihabitans sp. PhB188]
MELLFAALGGAILGLIVHFALPGQDSRGLFWTAGWATCAAIVVWEALTWLEWKSDRGWIWAVTLVVAALTGAAVARISARRRADRDRELFDELLRGQAA